MYLFSPFSMLAYPYMIVSVEIPVGNRRYIQIVLSKHMMHLLLYLYFDFSIPKALKVIRSDKAGSFILYFHMCGSSSMWYLSFLPSFLPLWAFPPFLPPFFFPVFNDSYFMSLSLMTERCIRLSLALKKLTVF